MKQSALEKCQELIGYRFKDRGLLKLALTHSSVAPTRAESNERLEFLGDAVLGLVACHELYEHQEELMEGEMTSIKSSVVSRLTCSEIAKKIGIDDLLILGKGMGGANGLPQSVAAAVFEAIIGAIYQDGGLAPAGNFILRHIRPYIAQALASEHQRNYKSLLQQFAQRRWGTTPEYELLDEQGPDHSKSFEVAVRIKRQYFPSAWAANKKEAEQKAARLALDRLGVLEKD